MRFIKVFKVRIEFKNGEQEVISVNAYDAEEAEAFAYRQFQDYLIDKVECKFIRNGMK